MAKKHRSQHITIFAVYKKFTIFGETGRVFKIAFPNRDDAEKWLDDHVKSHSFFSRDDFMVEEMPAIMKAWQP